jgi:hypothetical protein
MPSSLQRATPCDINKARIGRSGRNLGIALIPAEALAMILQSAELSPSQRATIEQSAGRKLQQQENIVLCGSVSKVASEASRQQAIQQMRHRLYILDRADRRMSIEDCVAAILEQSGTGSPA